MKLICVVIFVIFQEFIAVSSEEIWRDHASNQIDGTENAVELQPVVETVTAVYLEPTDEPLENEIYPCIEIFDPKIVQLGCCKFMELVALDMKECKKNLRLNWTCEDSMCMLNNSGLLAGDTINETSVRAILDYAAFNMAHPTKFMENVRKRCMYGKYDNYMPEDICSALKYQICIFANAVVYETEWKDTELCQIIAQLAEQCKSRFEALDARNSNLLIEDK